MEKILSGWKEVVQLLEELSRKIKYQEDINAYFKEMNELEKVIAEKESWLKNDSSASQPSAVLKDLCQVSVAKLVAFDWKLSGAQNTPEEFSVLHNVTHIFWEAPGRWMWLEHFGTCVIFALVIRITFYISLHLCLNRARFDSVFNLLQRELTYLVSLSPRLEHLKATCKVLTSQPVPPNFIQESLNGFLDRFKLTCQKLDERHQQLKKGKYSFIRSS